MLSVVQCTCINELLMLCQASVNVPHRQTGGVDRRQLSREIQELRVELSQKNLKLESMEADCQHKTAELEQRLGETLHQRQLLQVVCLSVALNEELHSFLFSNIYASNAVVASEIRSF